MRKDGGFNILSLIFSFYSHLQKVYAQARVWYSIHIIAHCLEAKISPLVYKWMIVLLYKTELCLNGVFHLKNLNWNIIIKNQNQNQTYLQS